MGDAPSPRRPEREGAVIEAVFGVVAIVSVIEAAWIYAFWSVKNRLPRGVEWVPGSVGRKP